MPDIVLYHIIMQVLRNALDYDYFLDNHLPTPYNHVPSPLLTLIRRLITASPTPVSTTLPQNIEAPK